VTIAPARTVDMTKPPTVVHIAGLGIHRFEREEFLTERWTYKAGEHVTFLGPTQVGKTTLAFELLRETAHPNLPALVLVMKPHRKKSRETNRYVSGDKTVSKYARALGFPIIRSYPPPTGIFWRKTPSGWVLWPKHTFDPEVDDEMLEREFRRALRALYKEGDAIIFGDEVYGLVQELGLSRELVAIWTRGASMGLGLWAASQKPSHIPLWAYSQAAHVFIHNDPDKRARERFGEIGGFDPRLIEAIVEQLEDYAWLYLRRRGRVMCIISP